MSPGVNKTFIRKFLIPIHRENVAKRFIKKEETLAEKLYIALQPTRRKILVALLKSPSPMYIEQIADNIGEDRKNVAFHMLTLQEYGFVEGEYGVIEPPVKKSAAIGKAGKFFKLTDEGRKVCEIFKKLGII